MSQTVNLWGATYSNVPYIKVPSGNGTAQFDDTSDADATAADITLNKTAWVNGVKLVGTNQGGGGGGVDPGQVYQDINGYIVLDDDPGSNITVESLSVTQNGTYTAPTGKAYSPVTVNVSGGGGGGGNMSDPIRFFDYDGTLVASYSAVPQSLPSVPSHTGLTNGTWNYTLQEVTTQFNAMGTCDVGANYETVSGATEIDIEFINDLLSPYLSFSVNGTVSIDWGDGSTIDSVTGTSLTTNKYIQHTYPQPGKYTIMLELASGTKYSMFATSSYPMFSARSSTASDNYVYSKCIKAIRIGENCNLGSYAFYNCTSLESICIPPSGITSMVSAYFNNCYELKCVVIPSTVTSDAPRFGGCNSLVCLSIPPNVSGLTDYFMQSVRLSRFTIPVGSTTIGQYAFSGSFMTRVDIPATVTTIKSYAFSGCVHMTSLVIPSSVSSIQNYALACKNIKEYHFKPTAPPTLSNVNALSGIPEGCVIYVPSTSLNDYKTAENWSTYADYMVGE